eukprot:10224537-Alexandrium_andersonii.AAC.1
MLSLRHHGVACVAWHYVSCVVCASHRQQRVTRVPVYRAVHGVSLVRTGVRADSGACTFERASSCLQIGTVFRDHHKAASRVVAESLVTIIG